MSGPWREAWVLMISKSYEWEGVLTNTHPIALIETARKVLSKILSDRISLACNTFDVLHGNNFSVLKDTFTQLPIFAIGLVIENALEKNQELWLVLQDIRKAYDSVGWEHLKRSLVRIKMLISHFVSKTGQVEFQAKLMLFLTANVFVDDTIWVGSSQAATQHILNVASDFFHLNDILINNNKTVIIPINCYVTALYLSISGMPIFITKKDEPHHYLGIFLFSEGLLKPSLVKAHSDVQFFINLILRKVISNKQFAYLVSSVLFPIVSYRTQFSFIPLSVCNKWDTLICKGLKSKSGLPLDFSNDALHYLSLHYGIAFIEQLCDQNGVVFDWKTFKHWKRLDPCGLVFFWFDLSVCFLGGVASLSDCSPHKSVCGSSDIHQSLGFGVICNNLLNIGAAHLSVYTDRSLSNLGTVDMLAGAVVFFENINSGLDVGVSGLVSSTLTKLQAIALALECVPSFCSVDLFSDSQAAIDACRSESLLVGPDFKNCCWIECHHIANIIRRKNLDVN
ncbi:hypothetical protein G9A89_001075 [Geosiphon pyriformis]|nr:hypothetical protein G9A89_001075 [Geosiphon pyriformis]